MSLPVEFDYHRPSNLSHIPRANVHTHGWRSSTLFSTFQLWSAHASVGIHPWLVVAVSFSQRLNDRDAARYCRANYYRKTMHQEFHSFRAQGRIGQQLCEFPGLVPFLIQLHTGPLRQCSTQASLVLRCIGKKRINIVASTYVMYHTNHTYIRDNIFITSSKASPLSKHLDFVSGPCICIGCLKLITRLSRQPKPPTNQAIPHMQVSSMERCAAKPAVTCAIFVPILFSLQMSRTLSLTIWFHYRDDGNSRYPIQGDEHSAERDQEDKSIRAASRLDCCLYRFAQLASPTVRTTLRTPWP